MPRLAAISLALAAFLMVAVPAPAQEPPGQIAALNVDFITTPVTNPDPAENLWKFLETATLEGPSPELLALNGLRIGKLDASFQKELDATIKKTYIIRRIPQMVQMLQGRPQEFALAPPFTDRTVFIWKTPDSFIGRHFGRASYGISLMVQPDANQRAQLSVAPILRYGDALNDYFDLSFLAVNASMLSGQSVVIMPTATPTGIGAVLYQGLDQRTRQRTLIVITLTSIRKSAPQ